MKVKQPFSYPTAVSPAEYIYEFLLVVKIVAASVVAAAGDQNPFIVEKYHDSFLNKYRVKRFKALFV